MEPDYAALSAMIVELYDAAIDTTKWTLDLQHACEVIGGAQATMFWQGIADCEGMTSIGIGA